jgi:hypothetical protein
MKPALVATIALCFAIYLIPGCEAEQPKPEKAQATNRDAPQPIVVVLNEGETHTRSQSEAGKQQSPHWYPSSEWMLVIIGFITAFVIGWQAIEMRRATVAMKESSGVVMNVEQGRLLIYWEQMIHLDSSPTGRHDGSLSHFFNWAVSNVGKTEITLTHLWARFIVIDNMGDLPAVPDYSAMNGKEYLGEPLLPSSSQKPQTEYFSTPLETALSYDQMEERYRKRVCYLYAYGFAKYIDVWGRPHETRFGVMRDAQPTLNFSRDNWVVAGPPAYNERTYKRS